MADANLNARPPRPDRFVTIQQSQRHRSLDDWLKHQRFFTEPPLYPWMKLSGRWIEHAGFKAGQRVRIEVKHGRLVIAPA
jgi:toxic protein SymE